MMTVPEEETLLTANQNEATTSPANQHQVSLTNSVIVVRDVACNVAQFCDDLECYYNYNLSCASSSGFSSNTGGSSLVTLGPETQLRRTSRRSRRRSSQVFVRTKHDDDYGRFVKRQDKEDGDRNFKHEDDEDEYESQEVSAYLEEEDEGETVWRCVAGLGRLPGRKASSLVFSGAGDDDEDEDVYESIYEVVNPPPDELIEDSESDFDEIIEEDEDEGHVGRKAGGKLNTSSASNHAGHKPLSKLAEAAGKKMKKLRRNWSLKKYDIGRSLSRIRKHSLASVYGDLNVTSSSSGGRELRRKSAAAPSTSASNGGHKSVFSTRSVLQCNQAASAAASTASKTTSQDQTMFYITLNIEDVGGGGGQEDVASQANSVASSRSGSKIMQTGGNVSQSGSIMSQSGSNVKPPPRRKSSVSFANGVNGGANGGANPYAVIRPTEAPPAPPPVLPTTTTETSPPPKFDLKSPLPNPHPPSFPHLREFYSSCRSTSSASAFSEDGSFSSSSGSSSSGSGSGSGLGLTSQSSVSDMDEAGCAYTSSLFQSEPLYQFYDAKAVAAVAAMRARAEAEVEAAANGEQSDTDTSVSSGSTHHHHHLQSCQAISASAETLRENEYECVRAEFECPRAESGLRQDQDKNGNLRQKSSASNDIEDDDDQSVCLRKGLVEASSGIVSGQNRKLKSRSSAMDLVHHPGGGGRRSMWSELPEVIESGMLDTLSLSQKKLEEALFEVLSSEASYLKSLNVLLTHFVQSRQFQDSQVLSKRDYRILFSGVVSVRHCSERLLADLERRCWPASSASTAEVLPVPAASPEVLPALPVIVPSEAGICEIVRSHARDNFQVYVKYCSNQVYQDRTLKKLKAENPKFVETLRLLESNPVCQSLDMHSFLMLPMQRITRLPLLLEAIFNRLSPQSGEYAACKEALDILNKLVKECNESARSMERMEELLILSQQLDFGQVRRAVPLISASRWLVRRGHVTRMWWRDQPEVAKLTFGRRVNRQTLCLFLFTDMLVITKKKSEDNYLVMDHCPRNLVTLSELDSTDAIPGAAGKHFSEGTHHLCWLTLLQNHESKTVEWLISFSSAGDRERWIESVSPAQVSENPEEKIYEDWDCPKVQGTRNYEAQDSDELALKKGEEANVLRKLSDSGWYYVERQSDGCRGWVPRSVTRELESSHIRARNFKQRHAFLKLLSTTTTTTPVLPSAAAAES